MTEFYEIGGHSTVVENWINNTRERRHDVFFTTKESNLPPKKWT